MAKLSYTEIQTIAGKLETASKNMETLLGEIQTLFGKIGTDGVWNGTAASQAKEQFDTLSAKFPQFSKSIDDCHKYLLSVVENYKAVDNAINNQQ